MGKNDSSTCAAPTSAPGYFSCTGTDGVFTKLATYQLPPSLIQEACNRNDMCNAFTIQADFTSGTLYSSVALNTSLFGFNLKLQAPQSLETNTVARSPAAAAAVKKGKFDGFQAFESTNLGILGAATTFWVTDPGVADILTTDFKKEICMMPDGKAICRYFTDAPPPEGYQLWQVTTDPSMTSYVSTSVCT